jgi:uridylate kinase
MYVHMRIPGENLRRPDSELPWTAPELKSACNEVAEIYHNAEDVDLDGLMVVCGAGNVDRSADIREEFPSNTRTTRIAGIIRRLGSLQNAVMISEELTIANVPNCILVAPGMQFEDSELNGQTSPYSESMRDAAYGSGSVVLIAGGAGYGALTDQAATMIYARQSARSKTEFKHIVLEAIDLGASGTVPRGPAEITRYDRISAGYIRDSLPLEPERFEALDMESLGHLTVSGSNLAMRVYPAGSHTPLDVLTMGNAVSTFITSGYDPPMNRVI